MPVEKEFKYLLGNLPLVETDARKSSKQVRHIEQGYFDKGGRIRRVQRLAVKNLKPVGPARHIFTYKHDLSDRSGTMEIETEIAPKDFERLWADVNCRLVKHRHDIHHNGFVWEVDCFKQPCGANYLILAECEVPETTGRPDKLLPLVERHLVHEVEENDKRFNNRRLSDPERVKVLYEEFGR